jgi:hypothetical protein
MGEIDQAAAALQQAQQRVDRHRHLSRREQQLQDELDGARAELERLAAAVEAEGRDVAKLERRGFSSMVAAMAGGKEERLDRERAELAQAELRWQAQAHHVETLERDRATVEAERFALADAGEEEARCRRLLVDRGGEDPTFAELTDAVRSVARQRELVRELGEARRAGRRALKRLAITQQRLDTAAAWSAGDVLGGGAAISAVKLNHMDQAHEGLVASRDALVVYRRELDDIRGLDAGILELSPSFGLLDLCFEGLIGLVVDLGADERIRNARTTVSELRGAIADQIEVLDERRSTARRELRHAEAHERELLARIDP